MSDISVKSGQACAYQQQTVSQQRNSSFFEQRVSAFCNSPALLPWNQKVANTSNSRQEIYAAIDNPSKSKAKQAIKSDDLSRKETMSNTELKRTIIYLETDIAKGECFDHQYAYMDIKIMPALIAQENKKYPGMNLSFLMGPQELPKEIISCDKGGLPGL